MLVLTATHVLARENTPTLDALLAEAEAAQREMAAEWREYERKTHRVIEDNRLICEWWPYRSAPPRPDLGQLQLPLAFLVSRLVSAPEGPRNAYTDAVIGNPDERKIDALLEYGSAHLGMKPGYAVAGAAQAFTLDRAVRKMRELASDAAELDDRSLRYELILRFAEGLQEDLRSSSYAYIRAGWGKGPTNGDGEYYWDVLFRLDVAKARRQVMQYYNAPRHRLYVLELLLKHAGPSEVVAASVRRWLAERPHSYRRLSKRMLTQLRVLLLRSDPASETAPTVERIASLILGSKVSTERPSYTSELGHLVRALIQIETKDALVALLTYVHEPAVDDLTRLRIVEWLVARRHPDLRKILARWMREENWLSKDHLRRASGDWGECGQKALEDVEAAAEGSVQ